MKCAYCGKKIETTDKRVHYCSLECKRKAYLERSKAYNKHCRATNSEYRKKTYERNLRRYYVRKHERYIELAKELCKICGDIDAIVDFLEANTRLRH